MPLLEGIRAFGYRPKAATRRILAINGDPDPRNSSFCARLCNAYVGGAQSAGWAVRHLNAGDIFFDAPGLPHGSDLKTVFADLLWATHLTLIFPLLEGEPPSVLSDLFQKHLQRNTELRNGIQTTRMIITTDMPAFLQREAFAHSAPAQRLLALLPPHTRQDFIGSIHSMGPEQQSWWFEAMREDGARAV